MTADEISSKLREDVNVIFNDNRPTSETKIMLKDLQEEMDEISGDIDIMIDTLPE